MLSTSPQKSPITPNWLNEPPARPTSRAIAADCVGRHCPHLTNSLEVAPKLVEMAQQTSKLKHNWPCSPAPADFKSAFYRQSNVIRSNFEVSMKAFAGAARRLNNADRALREIPIHLLSESRRASTCSLRQPSPLGAKTPPNRAGASRAHRETSQQRKDHTFVGKQRCAPLKGRGAGRQHILCIPYIRHTRRCASAKRMRADNGGTNPSPKTPSLPIRDVSADCATTDDAARRPSTPSRLPARAGGRGARPVEVRRGLFGS